LRLTAENLLALVAALWAATIGAFWYQQSQIAELRTAAGGTVDRARAELTASIGEAERRITDRLISLEKLIEARMQAERAIEGSRRR